MAGDIAADLTPSYEDVELLIARNGKAGTMRYINLKNYTMNDHAYILTVKKE